MKQMILLLVAVYSLIINQSNKSGKDKVITPTVHVTPNNNRHITGKFPPHSIIAPAAYILGNMYSGSYNPVYTKNAEWSTRN